jgi:class 3 adenylate cyclase
MISRVPPETRYAKSGEISVAYQTFGKGPDLVICPGWVSNVEYGWEIPEWERFHRELASFARVTIFDKRGTGLSDRNVGAATIEERMDDLRAVMDAASIPTADMFAISEGGTMAMLCAATFPRRVRSLVLFGTFACRTPQPDYPWAPAPEVRQRFFDDIEQHWHETMDIGTIAPSLLAHPESARRFATYFRMSASPQGALALAKLNTGIDIRQMLPLVRVPTLVLHREGDRDASVHEARYIASKIPGAKLAVLPGDDHVPFVGNTAPILDELRAFLTGSRERVDDERTLATVLFTDVVGSTAIASRIGDRGWRERLERHHDALTRHVNAHRGRLVKLLGDGALAVFDGPGRAVRCAQAIAAAPGADDIAVRCGLHAGEIERMGGDIGGIAVHVAARVMAEAHEGEVLATSTVRDLCIGSGLTFTDRGARELEGLPEPWRVFAAK